MKIKFLVLGFLLAFQSGFAEGVLKVMELPYTYLPLKAVEIDTRIDYQIAVTISRQTFANDLGMDVKLKYGFSLNAEASVTNVRWHKHGNWYQGEMVGRPQDTTAVNPGGEVDRQFLDYLGECPFFFTFKDSLAKDSTITIELTYLQLLEYDFSKIFYHYPADLKQLISGPLDSFKIKIDLFSDIPVSDFTSSSHPDCQFIKTDSSLTLQYQAYRTLPDKDFLATYQVTKDSLGIILFSYQPAVAWGYFLMLTEPPTTSEAPPSNPLCDIYLIDISGSMAGDKLARATEVVLKGIDSLKETDWFNIIAFSDAPQRFQPQPVRFNSANKQRANEFLTSFTANGKTKLQLALTEAFNMLDNSSSERRNTIIVVSDGETVLDFDQTGNDKQMPICAWGIGPKANRILLNRLVEMNGGFAVYPREDNREYCLYSFFNKIHQPFLSHLKINFLSIGTEEIFPNILPDLYIGEQLFMVGRYQSAGPVEVKISGIQKGVEKHWQFTNTFTNDSTTHPFVPKLWARKKIDDLLAQLSGLDWSTWQAKVLIQEIIDLSLEYGIMTQFTSYTDPGQPTALENNPSPESTGGTSPAVTVCRLRQNFPNPFNASTRLQFEILQNVHVKWAQITIVNLLGEVVSQMKVALQGSSPYEIIWKGCDWAGNPLPSGVYICVLKIGNSQWHQKMLLLR